MAYKYITQTVPVLFAENEMRPSTNRSFLRRLKMEKPESISAREFVDGLPYEGEYFQPGDSIYTKETMDKYIEFIQNEQRVSGIGEEAIKN